MDRVVILKRFKEMGLSSYESKSYLSLLEKDTLTVTEVAKIAGIPRTNAYEALEKLLAKGLCLARPGNTKKYSASDPILLKDKFLARADHAMEVEMANLSKKEEEILEKYNAAKESKLIDLNKKEKEILEENKTAKKNINKIIEELEPRYKNSRSNESPMEFIEIIKDPYQMHKRFLELIAQSKKEILFFSKPPYAVPKKGIEEQWKQQDAMREKGIVKLKSILEIPKNKEDIQWKLEQAIKTAGVNDEIRVIKKLPMKMAISDERIVMLALTDPISTSTSFTTQIIEHPELAKSLKITFETVWEQAEDFHIMEDLLKKM